MANHASALKRHRQNLKRRARNRAIKARLRTERKKLGALTTSGDKDAAGTQYQLVQKLLDQAVSKGVLHKKTTSRLLGRAQAKINAI